MKYFYAEYCPYGVHISYESLNGNAYTFYAFPSKKEREKWLDEHEWDRSSCELVAQETTRKTVESRLGKHFSVDRDERGNLVCSKYGEW